jgi:hypothetical protein
MPQYHNLTLIVGQLAYHFPDILLDLTLDHIILDIAFSECFGIEQVRFIVVIRNGIHLLDTPEVVNYKIMGNAHHPGNKFPVVGIFARFYRLYHFKEGILEDILSKSLIANI